MAHLQEVIVVDRAKGEGTEESPIHRVTEYWSKDGKLLATDNAYKGDLDLSGFRKWLDTLGRIEEPPDNQVIISNVGRLINEIERLRQ